MKTISPELKAHMEGSVTTLATCWKLIRTDDVISGYTNQSKDIEDLNGDSPAQLTTLPILIGRDRTTIFTFALSFIPLLAVVQYIVLDLYNNIEAIIYFLIFVVGPMLYFTIKTFSAEQKKDYHHLSNVLKVIMLFGVLSLLLYPLVFN